MINNPEKDIIEAAKQICIAARTAPKAKGKDTLITTLLNPKDYPKIIKQMDKLYKETNKPLFKRDAQNLKESEACILIGVKNASLGLNCGACGYSCAELENLGKLKSEHYNGPNCIFKAMDLGIALGSASRTAMQLCIDNRQMYSIGLAAKQAGVIDSDIAIALPLSIKGKNIYFDRK